LASRGGTTLSPDVFQVLLFDSGRRIPSLSGLGETDHAHEHRSYAHDGVVAGTSGVSQLSISVFDVGIVCENWPSWIYALAHNNFTIKFICVLNDHLLDDVSNTFRDILVVPFPLEGILSRKLPPVDILCFNGKGARLSVPPPVGVILFFDWKFRNRGHWRDWNFRSSSISHARCGGVTDFQCHITIGRHESVIHWWLKSFNSLIGSYPSCHLSALVKCTVGGTELVRDPQLPLVVPPGMVVPLGRNLFHYKGLFPFGSWKTEFITPCVFSSLRLI
jgi:hypothetical protein